MKLISLFQNWWNGYNSSFEYQKSIFICKKLNKTQIDQDSKIFTLSIEDKEDNQQFKTIRIECSSSDKPKEIFEMISIFCEKSNVFHTIDLSKIKWSKTLSKVLDGEEKVSEYTGTYKIDKLLIQPNVIMRVHKGNLFPNVEVYVLEI